MSTIFFLLTMHNMSLAPNLFYLILIFFLPSSYLFLVLSSFSSFISFFSFIPSLILNERKGKKNVIDIHIANFKRCLNYLKIKAKIFYVSFSNNSINQLKNKPNKLFSEKRTFNLQQFLKLLKKWKEKKKKGRVFQ